VQRSPGSYRGVWLVPYAVLHFAETGLLNSLAVELWSSSSYVVAACAHAVDSCCIFLRAVFLIVFMSDATFRTGFATMCASCVRENMTVRP
jgi:hypothetical protein